jgi:hypothetical protein
VLNLVRRLEHGYEEFGFGLPKRVEDDLALAIERFVQIFQEYLFVDFFLVQRPRVLGPPQRLVEADPARDLRRVVGRLADGSGSGIARPPAIMVSVGFDTGVETLRRWFCGLPSAGDDPIRAK